MSLHKSNTAWSWCLDGRHHLIYVITTAIGWAIPSGPTEVANVYRVVWSLPSCFRRTRLYVIGWTIPRVCTRMERYPVAWNLSPCCLLFLHNTVANMLCRLFDDCKYIDIYLPIPQEYCYIGKQKKFVFSRINVWSLVTFTPLKLFKLTNRRHLYWVCANILRSFKKNVY